MHASMVTITKIEGASEIMQEKVAHEKKRMVISKKYMDLVGESLTVIPSALEDNIAVVI